MDNILLQCSRVGEIPLLLMAPEGARSLPLVIAVHGFFGRKEHNLELGERLVRAGFVFAALDAPLHGEREDPRLAASLQGQVYPPQSGLDTFYLMLQTAAAVCADIDRLIDHFAADPRVDANRVGVTGLSFGGTAAFYAAANLPRVRAAVTTIAHPSFYQRWLDVIFEASSYPDMAAQMAAAQEETMRRAAWMRQVDPLARLKAAAPKPLLVQCGDQDTHMPKFYAVRALQELQPAYAQEPERLRLSIHDGVDHRVTEEMRAECAAWFGRWLGS